MLDGADIFGITKAVLGLAESLLKSGNQGIEPRSHAVGYIGFESLNDGSHLVAVGFSVPRVYCRPRRYVSEVSKTVPA